MNAGKTALLRESSNSAGCPHKDEFLVSVVGKCEGNMRIVCKTSTCVFELGRWYKTGCRRPDVFLPGADARARPCVLAE